MFKHNRDIVQNLLKLQHEADQIKKHKHAAHTLYYRLWYSKYAGVNTVVALFYLYYCAYLPTIRLFLPTFSFSCFALSHCESRVKFLFLNPAALLPFPFSLHASLDSPLPHSSHPPPPPFSPSFSFSLSLPFHYNQHSHPHMLIFSRLI